MCENQIGNTVMYLLLRVATFSFSFVSMSGPLGWAKQRSYEAQKQREKLPAGRSTAVMMLSRANSMLTPFFMG